MDKIWANSGDAHVLEPPTLWAENMPATYAARMPRTEKISDSAEVVHIDGKSFERPLPKVVRDGEFAGMTFREIENRPPGAYDPHLRLKDLNDEGIWGEVIYPSLGLWNGLIRDRELYHEGVKVMNDWLKADIMSVSRRYVPTAQVSILDVNDAIEEMQRTRSMGFQAIQLPTSLDTEHNWNSDYWEPLWAACEEAGTVLAFHIGSDAQDPSDPGLNVFYRGAGAMVLNYVETTYSGQRTATMMVASGALDRHPDLKVLVSEGGATWVPFIADRMDEGYRQHGMFTWPKLSRLPSEIIMSQVYTSFQHDASAVGACRYLGYNNVLWGSDYPHLEGTFGHTQQTLHELFDGEEPALVERITQGAFLELFPSVGSPDLETIGTTAEVSAA